MAGSRSKEGNEIFHQLGRSWDCRLPRWRRTTGRCQGDLQPGRQPSRGHQLCSQNRKKGGKGVHKRIIMVMISQKNRRGMEVCPSVYRHASLLNHYKTNQTSLYCRSPGTMYAYPLTPFNPVGLPRDPLGPCRHIH